jgi:hypothetical protein
MLKCNIIKVKPIQSLREESGESRKMPLSCEGEIGELFLQEI